MKRILFAIFSAIVTLFALPTALAADEYVFDAPPTYEYRSDALMIGIEKVQENGVTYFLADVRIHEPDHMASAMAGKYEGVKNGKKSEPTSAIAERNKAVLAINADNFKSHSAGLIIRNGEVMRKKGTTRHLMAIDASGNLEMFNDRPATKVLAEMLMAQGVQDSFEFGPVLVENGQATDLGHSFRLIATRDSILEPRTAIGQLGPLHYLIIVVDGRHEGYSKGMNLRDLQGLFLCYGAQSAFNLDGGGSTTLYFNGEVINRPSGGRQRSVSDVILFRQ
ncbi:MAG: phosphodiester glycosidase family protein [Clostridia bacterium]